jgi:DNA-binding transcriptional MocR family regulator
MTVREPDSKPTELKYKQLAQELEEAIRQGRVPVGSRLQSVRKVMVLRGVSLATVLSAYRSLEERGLVAARPKKGYFVVSNGCERSGAKFRTDRSGSFAPPPVAASRERFARLPDTSLFPTQRLHRLTASMVRRHQYVTTRRPDVLGLSKFRREIARRSADVGNFVRLSEVLVTNGATEGLSLAIRAVTEPGDSLAVQAPVNPRVLALLQSLHVRAIGLIGEPGRGVSKEVLVAALASQPTLRACLLVPNFHDPTGELMPVSVKRDLVEFAGPRGLAIIEADVYGDLQHEGPRPPPLKSFDTTGAVIYVTSYATSVAPGLQVGWLAGGRWHGQITASKQSTAAATAELPQLVIHEFLSRGSHIRHFRRLRQTLRERTLRVSDALRKAIGTECHWSVPDGGYFLWLEFPEHVDAAQLLSRSGLTHPSLVPGRAYSSAEHGFSHCLCVNTSLIDSATITALAKLVRPA